MVDLSKIKDMYAFQKKAKQAKKDLKNTHIEAEVDGVVVVLDGEQEVISINIPDEALQDGKRLADSLVKCMNKAVKKSQQVAADVMKEIMGDMNMPGFS